MPNGTSTKTPFVSRALQLAVEECFSKYVATQVRAKQEAFVDPNNMLEFQHGRNWASPANQLGDQAGQVEPHSFEISVKVSEVVAGNPAIIFENAERVATGMNNSIERMMFAKIYSSTEQSGNTVNVADHSSFPEAFAETLEKMEMSVDEQGNLQLPTIAVGPKEGENLMKQLQAAGPEFEKRIEELKERKKQQALEREAQRVGRFDRRSE